MKKLNTNNKHNLAIAIVCILCFALGVSVPVILNKSGQSESDEWTKLKTVYSILTEKWYYADQVEDLDSQLIEQAISGMADLDEDAHTNYFSLEQAQKFSSTLEGSNVGIGFVYYLSEDNEFVVKNVFVNSPADLAGLKKGDIVTSIAGINCSESDSSDVIDKIKSSEGQALDLVYLRDGEKRSTSITPQSYDATVSLEMNDEYALVILSSFSEDSASDFNEAMQRIKEAGIHKLILDLRDDTGGYLTSVLDISSCLLPKNSVVFKEKNKDGTIDEQISSNKYEQVEMDSIVVIQNENTASAAEVLIGALKDHLGEKVKTVGVTTYGKGTEQTSIPFSDGTSMKYTVAEWTTPNGTCINLKGFEPDIEVEQSEVSRVTYTTLDEDEVIEVDTVHKNAKAIQIYLDYLGYTVDRKDEYFSVAGSQALQQFQNDHQLEATGNCDKQTWEKLKEVVLLKVNKNLDTMDYQMVKAIENL